MFLGGGGEDGTTKEVMRDVENTNIQNSEVDEIGDAENTQISQDISKADLLARMMRDNKTLEQIGSAWTLYLRLALIEGGTMTGTYDEFGQALATSGKTIRNWVKNLEASGIVKLVSKGHRVSIELLGDHMSIAQAPNAIRQVESEVKAPEVKPMSPMEIKALKFVHMATETGATLEFNLKMVGKG